MSQFYDPKSFNKIDRQVHAMTADGWHVVRYDRAGKWYIEKPATGQKLRVSIKTAVTHATDKGSVFFSGRPGGKSFDARVRKIVKERNP